MHRGYIKLWRKVEDWTWYKDSNTFSLWIHLLISANYKDSSYMGVQIPRGSLVCGRKALAEQTGLSVKNVRTSLKRLKSTNDVAIKTTNRFSVVSIVNYDLYQDREATEKASKVAIKRPSNGHQVATSKECKNDKNEKKDATINFLDSLKANKAYLGVDIEREFLKCQTWCAVNKKMLSERRFVNWLNRAEKPVVFTPAKKERLPSPTCTACNGSGKLPDGKTCWCLK